VIDRRSFIKAAGATVAGLVLPESADKLLAWGKKTHQKQPNIVFILVDDLGFGDVGFNGSSIRTPNIDQLAAQGVRLNQFYVQPLCSPTRASLMTGRYPIRYGLQVSVIRPWADYGLPLTERLLPQVLKDAGYTTAICGKWHLGNCAPEYLPTHRGFDHQYGCYTGAIDYYKHTRNGALDWNRDDKSLVEDGYATDLIADEAVRLIQKQNSSKPLFLYVPFTAPHQPLQAPDSYLEMYTDVKNYEKRNFAAMVTCLDNAVGKIIAALDKRKIRKNTLVIFCSDNGAVNGIGDNDRFRGCKAKLYEGGVRVPMVLSWPGVLGANSVVNEPLHIVDMFPTLIKLAGAPVPQSPPIDGKDAWPTIAHGKPSPHDEILINATPFHAAIRRGNWKLIRNGNLSAAYPKLEAEKDWLELFNLDDDPGERKNLIEHFPNKVEELKRRIDVYTAVAVQPKISPAKMPRDFTVPRAWGHTD
jgi:arylsulfatase A-like enzyme